MKVVFLDRDGVINAYPGDKNYVTSWENFKFLPRSKEALVLLRKAGFSVFVVSNQAGVSKGLYTQKTLDEMTLNMLKEVRQAGGQIDGIYYCIHTSSENCSCRKPKTGLLEKAAKEHKFKLEGSFFVGDSMFDLQAAHAAGAKAVLVLSGKEKILNRDNWEEKPDFVFSDLFEAAQFIINPKIDK